MKIKAKYDEIVDVFAIYWINEQNNFLGMPRNLGGLMAFGSDEVEVIDPGIKGEWVYWGGDGWGGVYHWALIKEKLLDDLSELDVTAYNRFLEIIKSEGLVDPDFY